MCATCSVLGACSPAANNPLHLQCIDASPFLSGLCRKGEPLFLKSITPWGGGLSTACFLRDSGIAVPPDGDEDAGVIRRRRLDVTRGGAATGKVESSDDNAHFCSPPAPIDDLALVVAPIPEERFENDPDLCGYYFFPYDLAEDINAANGGFEVADMDVQWPKHAFAHNAQSFPNLDFSLVERDTYTQRHIRKTAPFIEPKLGQVYAHS